MTFKATADTLGALAGDTPRSISPITFKMRSNPYATAAPKPTPPGVLPLSVEVRQMSLFGAAWTLGSIASLVASSIDSATLYETVGWRGVMDTDAGSPEVAPRFYSAPGMTYPLYCVLADVGEFAGGEAYSLRSSDPLRAAGLLLRKDGKARLLLANLTAQEQTLVLPDLDAARIRVLDETTFEQAARDAAAFRASGSTRAADTGDTARITLRAYGVACVDG